MTQNDASIPSRGKIFFKWFLRILSGFALLIIIAYIGFALYVNANKKELLQSMTETLNENINGKLTIESMEPAFLRGFPRLSLNLKNVRITDSLYPKHKHVFLQSEDFYISVNTLALLHGTIEIRKIEISNAKVNLFTDAAGYSNSSVFKKSAKKESTAQTTMPELKKFSLDNVSFTIDNQKNKKLFRFDISSLDGNMDYTSSGVDASLKLNAMARNMAFNTGLGSFIKDKKLDGKFDISYTSERIVVKPNGLEIGGEDFVVSAGFELEKSAAFEIHIKNEKIFWRNASALLSPNISSKLDMFNLSKPIVVSCDIVGDFDQEGDPLILVKAKIRDNELDTPGGKVSSCNFDGEFTNNYIKENGFNDKNSAIKLKNFNGQYAEIPFVMQKIYILDLEKPIAMGDFTSEFEISKINNIVDKELIDFTKGTSKVNVNFKADIVNYKLAKPIVDGKISIANANIKYMPRKLSFNDVSVLLDFKDDNLSISNIHLRSGKSIVNMEGGIQNFLNLYYTAPEKIVVNWKVQSPQLHLGEFLGFVGTRTKSKKVKSKKNTVDFTEDLNVLFDKFNVDMSLHVDKLYYDRFYATDAKALLYLSQYGIRVKNAGLKHAGGTVTLNGNLSQKGSSNPFAMKAVVNHVDISKFFYGFNNFGLASLKSENLKGFLSAQANLTGKISNSGTMIPKSMYGNVNFDLQKGRLLQFDPIKNVGKFAFPFRDFETISFNNLKGNFDISGHLVKISPMQINSSILNMDLEGIYSFGTGTNIFITVPLRNPKKDENITDKEELKKRRNRGILLRLVAADDKNGKVKIGLGKKKDDATE